MQFTTHKLELHVVGENDLKNPEKPRISCQF